MVFNDDVKFKGTFRKYQQRVLDNISPYLENDKIHIVAAPGSGKTILGLELIVRLNNYTLILAPSITIREQWALRFKENFSDGDYISNSILNIKPITIITYQAFYSAYKNIINEENDDEVAEKVDYKNINLIDIINKYNIKTLCLDECHHLKSEWEKAITDIVNKINNLKIIALTATPPYDTMSSDWQRYVNLCGPIDDEIFVPELIKDKNLCYHQDFVYFSYPSNKEYEKITKYYSASLKTFNKYKNNATLLEIVRNNKAFNDILDFYNYYYTNYKLANSLARYLYFNKVKLPFYVRQICDYKIFEKEDLEIILQDVLFDNSNIYNNKDFILSLKKELATLKDKFSCLVLTDYIKISSKDDVVGSIPAFNRIINSNINNIKCAVLTGTICIIPECIKEKLIEKGYELTKYIDGYYKVKTSTSNKKELVSYISLLTKEKYLNVIIGTKSLLGEGWDLPVINVLILATFIGSYVSSNQTRGRAIRTNNSDINKVSSIWHLCTLNPLDYRYNNDLETIKRRFNAFVGVSFENNIIENGLDRLNIKTPLSTSIEASIENDKMLKEATNKNKTIESWNKAISNASQVESLSNVLYVSNKRLHRSVSFITSFIMLSLITFLTVLNVELLTSNKLETLLGMVISLIAFIPLSIFLIRYILYIYYQVTYLNKLKYLSKATLKALKEINTIKSNAKIKVYKNDKYHSCVYLKNASIYEQNMFVLAMQESLSNIDSPRYLLYTLKRFFQFEFLNVPSLFKKNNKLASIYLNNIKRYFLGFNLTFTKNDFGKYITVKFLHTYNFLYKDVEVNNKLVLTKK